MSKKLRRSHKDSACALAVEAVSHWADLEGLSFEDAASAICEIAQAEQRDSDGEDEWTEEDD